MSTTSSRSSLYAGSAAEEVLAAKSDLPSHIATALHDALYSEKLDRCIALQSRISGQLHAQSASIQELNALATREIVSLKEDFREGAKVATTLKANLQDIQQRLRACEILAKKKIPVEWYTSRDRLESLDDED